MRPLCVVSVAAWAIASVAASAMASNGSYSSVKPIGCFDSYWAQHLRSAVRLVQWSKRKVDFGSLKSRYYNWQHHTYLLDCRLDLEEEDASVLKKAIDDCLCVRIRRGLLTWVRDTFSDELLELPAAASVDAFYVSHARAQIRMWRRGVALEGDKSLVTYFDGLVDQCFTQPHLAAASHRTNTATAPVSTTKTSSSSARPSGTTNTTRRGGPPAVPTPTQPRSPPPPAAPPREPDELVATVYLLVLAAAVGAMGVVVLQSFVAFIRTRSADSPDHPDRRAYVAIASPRSGATGLDRESATEEEEVAVDLPLLAAHNEEARVERSVQATE